MKVRKERLIHPWSQETERAAPQRQQHRYGAPGSRSWTVHQRIKCRRWYWKDPEHAREITRQKRLRHLEQRRADTRAYMANWRQAHREEDSLRSAVYRETHHDEVLARLAEKRAADPNHYLQIQRDWYTRHGSEYNEMMRARRAAETPEEREQRVQSRRERDARRKARQQQQGEVSA